MADDRYAQQAARVLRATRGRLGLHADDDPAVTIARLADAIVVTAQRRRRRRTILACGAAVASAVAVLTIGMVRPQGPVSLGAGAPAAAERTGGDGTTKRPARGGQTADRTATLRAPLTVENVGAGRLIGGAGVRTALPGAPLGQGDILETDTAAVALRSPDGTRLVVGPHTDLALTRDGGVRWFRLARGELDLEVATLSPGERFVVETPDREVEVKGTRFRIQLVSRDACGAGTITRVNVEKGVVTVREKDGAEDAVRAGGSWPPACADGQAVQTRREISVARAGDTPSRAAEASRRNQTKPSHAAGRASSTLAIENDLFSSAVHAERLGDKGEALRALDRLISGYPASPLREAATSERLKIAGPSPADVPAAPLPPPRPL
jgi:hypothetical protein